ncbi:hypothetical protein [Actinomyces sp. HMSC065F12]|uniref:hypothetical protein n=1 Tax=Actinomyces sp. HMSC065F12 TaxID=1739479 RepID=UPI0008A42CC6|nr:hypothetical protein [Actinomyces sp. HMSC065F12]OFP74647.1 hypothetical protein HMPREF2975_07000 [Actinomyces sp. HMSC065F12]
MTTSFQPRKPAGSPQGGQFDTKPHDQIGSALDTGVTASDLENPDGTVNFAKIFAEETYGPDDNRRLFGVYVDYDDQLRSEQVEALLQGDPDSTVDYEIFTSMTYPQVYEKVTETLEAWEESMGWEEWDALLDRHFDGDRTLLEDEAREYYMDNMDEDAMSQLVRLTRNVDFRHDVVTIDTDEWLEMEPDEMREAITDRVMSELVAKGVDDTAENRAAVRTMVDKIDDDDLGGGLTLSVAGRADASDLLCDEEGNQVWWWDSTVDYERPYVEMRSDSYSYEYGPVGSGYVSGTLSAPLMVEEDCIHVDTNIMGEKAASSVTRRKVDSPDASH